MNIGVFGLGYVGLSNALLLSKQYAITAVDTNAERVNMINQKIAPISDEDIQNRLSEEDTNLFATTDPRLAAENADIVIIATPTNYDAESNYFDTTSVEQVISLVTQMNTTCLIVVKSTVPVGFTDKVRREFNSDRILFSPEFLREGQALRDNLHPSRIIVGDITEDAKAFANMLKDCSNETDVPILLTHSKEAEAIKLFANTYLAMRIAFFNELDTYSEIKGLDSKEIIQGIGLDPRIGSHYNNPSFGYGGYCLPKDTKQLLANYEGVPNEMIKAIVSSNVTRKQFIADSVLEKAPKTVGIYRLVMKSGSDNFRESAVLDIIRYFNKQDIRVLVYEPTITEPFTDDFALSNHLDEFKSQCDCILTNRMNEELASVSEKVYTRDLFGIN